MKNSRWNETGIPLAHLISFRCYGTWLHGDKRGSTDKFNNKYGTPFLPANEKWNASVSKVLSQEPVKLNSRMRKSVENALRQTCEIRGLGPRALSVRTNHVHIVVAIGERSSKRLLIAFKANATRRMRKEGVWNSEYSPWAKKGSRRFLWNEKSVEQAIDYVVNGQGKPLPDFR